MMTREELLRFEAWQQSLLNRLDVIEEKLVQLWEQKKDEEAKESTELLNNLIERHAFGRWF